ncbi:MAG: EboA domain-containing protein [Chitinophagaceae bacterium]|nr:EboA domain-containing protein [Chitinophagaceae bacterium]
MYSYDSQKIITLFGTILQQNISAEGFMYLKEKIPSLQNPSHFNTTFVTLPRKTGKQTLNITKDQLTQASNIRPGLTISGWSADRLARAYIILQLEASDREKYFKTLESLFRSAEVNELVALYSCLPLFAWPEMWIARCSEGIRSNIGDVLKAIMCNNPYPSENLSESAWNQLVLKAVFTEKPLDQVIGLDARANERLARTLSDYAHERWAAHRNITPELWRCVAPFIDEQILPDVQKLLSSAETLENEAAALAIYNSNFDPAKKLLPGDYKTAIENGTLSWKILAEKMNDHVLQ